MTNPFLPLVEKYRTLLEEGRTLPPASAPAARRPAAAKDAPVVLLFSPHPDDECVMGAFPLRLRRESEMRVVNVAVTLGSRGERRKERWEELQESCAVLGFEPLLLREDGLEGITPAGRRAQPERWREAVGLAAACIEKYRPRVVFLPHRRDWNETHVGTQALAMEAIRSIGSEMRGSYVVETEYWSTMASPNLLVESSVEDVADLLYALSCHVGEVRRNPHYLALPGWMQDNVRRGAEVICGQGASAPDIAFGTLYRVLVWDGHRPRPPYRGGKVLPSSESVATLFRG